MVLELAQLGCTWRLMTVSIIRRALGLHQLTLGVPISLPSIRLLLGMSCNFPYFLVILSAPSSTPFTKVQRLLILGLPR